MSQDIGDHTSERVFYGHQIRSNRARYLIGNRRLCPGTPVAYVLTPHLPCRFVVQLCTLGRCVLGL